MAENSNISWTDHTFNPWIGCARVSPACDGCYAAAMMGVGEGRFERAHWGGPGKGEGTRARTAPSNWAKVRKWNREAASAPGQTFVFCASLADVFDNAVPTEWRRDLFDLIRETPNLTYLLLTKRPGMIVKLFEAAHQDMADACHLQWPSNAAIGCTVVNQEEVDRDVPKLLAAKLELKPAFAFLSMEPLLGEVDMRRWLPQGRLAYRKDTREPFYAPHWYMTRCEHCGWVGSSEFCGSDSFGDDGDVYCPACSRSIMGDDYPIPDWVITGGETDQGGHKARPTHPSQFRTIRDQCEAANVAYHHKQNGEWGYRDREVGPSPVFRIGKAAAGRLLDGVEHNDRPIGFATPPVSYPKGESA